MPFGNFVVRVAGSHDRKKWITEIHKTARAALKSARSFARKAKHAEQVCVFDMRKWGARPVCIESAAHGAMWRGKRQTVRRPYRSTAMDPKIDFRTGPKMKRLRPGGQSPALDGLRRRRRSRR